MSKIVIFTGAGISAESGIPTFRDSGGLWENYRVEEVCIKGCLETNREIVNRFYDERRMKLANVEPNKAHFMIAEMKTRYPEYISVITQNVDDLFERAGCPDVIHVHGFLPSVRCESCENKKEIGYRSIESFLVCDECGSAMRPDIVFFNERAPKYADLYQELKECELFIVIGTSGYVVDVMQLRRGIKYTVLNNLEPSTAIKSKKFTKVLYKPASEAADSIRDWIENYIHSGELELKKERE